MRVLLSGSSGFVGGSVWGSLVKNGAYVGVIRRGRYATDPGGQIVLPAGAGLREQVVTFDPDVIIHAATKFVREHLPTDIPHLIESNVEFGTRLLDAALVTNARFISLSTAWQHHGGADYSPVNLYAATKQAFDDITIFYQSRGLKVSRLTLFDTYGPGDRRGKIVSRMMEAAKTGDPLMATSGTQLIDLTYVADVAEAVVGVALNSPKTRPIDAVVKSGARSLREVALVLESAIGRPVPIEWGVQPDNEREMKSVWDFGEPLRGWTPKFRLAQGFRLTWQKDWMADGNK